MADLHWHISRRTFLRGLIGLGLGAGSIGSLLSGVSCDSPAALPTPDAAPSDQLGRERPATTAAGAAGQPATGAGNPPGQGAAREEMASPEARTPVSSATSSPRPAYLAVVRGQSPAAMVEAAIGALGGIERFVKSGNDVIVKPNICVAYHSYEYAATTNPEVVGTLVGLCRQAGARRVRVMDAPFGGTAEQAYSKSGIGEAVRKAGGQMEVMAAMKYQDTAIPRGRDITRWKVYRDALEADVLINVPIAKHHNLAGLTLGMKNLMGLVLERERMHGNLGQRVADLASLLQPDLTVVDAVRILINNGPTGGNLKDVRLTNTIIASHDVVAADAFATSLFGLAPAKIPAIIAGAQTGLGVMDLSGIQIAEIAV